MMENLKKLFGGKESKKEEAKEKKLPPKAYAKGEKMEEAAMKKMPAKKTAAKPAAKKAKK
jgi:hypothetical protein